MSKICGILLLGLILPIGLLDSMVFGNSSSKHEAPEYKTLIKGQGGWRLEILPLESPPDYKAKSFRGSKFFLRLIQEGRKNQEIPLIEPVHLDESIEVNYSKFDNAIIELTRYKNETAWLKESVNFETDPVKKEKQLLIKGKSASKKR